MCAGNSPASDEFPAQKPVTRSFDVFFDLCLNKRLLKQTWGWWFETLSRPLWRHCNENMTQQIRNYVYCTIFTRHTERIRKPKRDQYDHLRTDILIPRLTQFIPGGDVTIKHFMGYWIKSMCKMISKYRIIRSNIRKLLPKKHQLKINPNSVSNSNQSDASFYTVKSLI